VEALGNCPVCPPPLNPALRPLQLWRLWGSSVPSIFAAFFVIFARHRGKLNLRARRKEKQGSKWVKQECGSNRILRREENFKVVGYRYPLHLRPLQLSRLGCASGAMDI